MSRSEFEALSIHEGTVIFADDAEEPSYLNVVSYELFGDEYKILTVGSDVDDIYEELDIYFKESMSKRCACRGNRHGKAGRTAL